MSTLIMSACWPLQKMSATTKAVLISLADNANDQGQCWPSIDTIAKRTCLHRSNVIKAIRKLEQLGYVVADRTNGRHSRYTVTPNLDLFPNSKPVVKHYPSRNTTGSATRLNLSRSATGPVAERDTNRQEPSINKEREGDRARETPAGQACRLMLDAGCGHANPGHIDLVAALREGVTPEILADTVREAVAAGKSKPFAWAITTARNRNSAGASPIRGSPSPPANKQVALEARNKAAAQEWLQSQNSS